MTDLRQAAQQALEALERYQVKRQDFDRFADEITALKAALEQPEQEPFEYWNAVEGWVKIDEVREHFDSVGCGTIYRTAGEDRVPLYTTPPAAQRPWVGLTDEEILRADPRFGKSESDVNPYQILGTARDLEAKLKERNT